WRGGGGLGDDAEAAFGEAVAAWEMMLKLLPAGDARRAVIERSIRLAQEK
ncbi:hypothetical protein PL244_17240, partial [Salmonella enterica]|nr:hypothetical protein [Salmonella enterica]